MFRPDRNLRTFALETGSEPRWTVFRRYPWVRQNDETDCGAAALATLARYYRRPLSVERMRDLAGTDRVGTNLLGLLRAAQQLGFSARAVKGSHETLPQVPLPAIAHVQAAEGHPVRVTAGGASRRLDGRVVLGPGRRRR